MRVLVDADPIVYSAGFAAQARIYAVTWIEADMDDPDNPDMDTIHQAEFKYKKEVNEYLEQYGLDELDEPIHEVDTIVIPEPLSHALHLVRTMLENIRLAVQGALAESGDTVEEFLVFLSGSDNFRYDIATIKGYKANRDPQHKPHWYREIRQYMVERWDADVIEPWEADDMVSILQTEDPDNTIIATIDKDLLMVPGFQYNYRTKEFEAVDYQDARVAFYRQLLGGDATDNIGGVYKLGKKGAAKMITHDMTEEEMYEVALQAYQDSIDKHGEKTGYADLGAEAALLENARLLWMLEYPGQLWTPPGQEDELWEVMQDD